MAREIRSYAITIPSGTQIDAGWSTDISMPVRTVTAIEWMVPAGPRGHMGWALGSSGVRVIPINDDAWIIADDEHEVWPLHDQIQSGSWTLFGYNTGDYDHTVYLIFHLEPVTQGIRVYRQPLQL